MNDSTTTKIFFFGDIKQDFEKKKKNFADAYN